ncbi:MAG: hypothetical protein JWM34_2309 [Ilumatobacteraceae bacterium]|nr:hypothetical protein [Ilumatobacteraceae bacterium]
MPTEPPPVGALSLQDEPPPRGRLLTGIVVVVAAAVIAALGLTLISTRSDLTSERAKVAQLDVSTDTTAGPSPGADELAAVQAQLNSITSTLTQAQTDLATERAAHAADLATAASAAAAAAATATSDATAASDAAAAAATAAASASAAQAQQIAQLQALFPVTSAALAAADPTGAYAVTLTPTKCTLADCTPIASMSLTFASATSITGDRTTGTATVANGTTTLTGTVPAALEPSCAGVPAPATYSLVLAVTAAGVGPAGLQATAESGTYTETVSSGACASQSRAYTIALTRQ